MSSSSDDNTMFIQQLREDELFEECAQRLRNAFFREHGKEFEQGKFEFTFQNGRFQGIDALPRMQRYVSPFRKAR